MPICKLCFQEVHNGISVPGFQQATGAIHEECLAATALKVAEDPQKDGLLRYLIDWEEHATEERRLWSKQTSGGSADVSWEWKEVNIPSYKIRSLLDVGLAAVVFSTNKSTNYALVGRQVIKEALGKVDQTVIAPPEAVEIPNDLFDCIVGYDDIKEEMKLTITGSRKNHYLLIGPPATSTSLFLMELGRLGGAYAATGSRVTAAGLTDAFFAYQPKALLLDEIDKIPMDATAVLLSAMETGDILVTKYKTHRQLKLEVIVFAAGNTDRTIAPELLSRFDTKLYFPPYTFQDFITICSGYLSRYENISDTLAKYIGTQTWNLLDKDVRTARGVARRLREATTADVDRAVRFLRKYAKES